MRREIVLNGFTVPPALARLMVRADWSAHKRTDPAWLARFPPHPDSTNKRLPFVHFCSPESAVRENEMCRKPALSLLLGRPDAAFPPGDFDPAAGYLIGFTDDCDSCICVDLRPAGGARIIYECLAPRQALFRTAFDSLDAFVAFYLSQHGDQPLSEQGA